MGVPGNANPLLLASQDTQYTVPRSIRLNSSDSAYLSRTPSSAGNRKTWTFSCWVKRASLGRHVLLSAYINGSDYTFFQFNASDQLAFEPYTNATTAAVFRDFSAWYHIVCAVNTTLATQADRVKIYVNGTRQTLSTSTGITQNADTAINSANIHNIASGYYGSPGVYTNAYMAEVFLIDGQELDPSSFGQTDANGEWQPKAYTGSYGTNGFRLDFSDNSAATATTLGKDRAGSNNWTPNNLSVTAGAGNDSLVDTPTSYGTDAGNGGEVRGNYCTWNPNNSAGGTLSNGNLDSTNNTAGRKIGTIGASSGKWYWEITINSASDVMVGIAPPSNPASTVSANFLAGVSGEYGYYFSGNKYAGGTATAYGAAYTSGDVIGVALDLDAGSLVFYKNGASQGTAFTGLSGTFAPAASNGSGSTGASISANFGQRPFAYTAPSGFKALCDTNLPVPQVAKPSGSFDIALYTGNSSTQSITLPGGMSPDLVWVKTRSAASYYHALYDTVRGTGPSKSLYSNVTDAEGAQSIYTNLTSFDSSGFSLGSTSPNNNILNQSGQTFVAWCWDAGSSTVTNTQGSITSTVRANASAGFSIVTYTGTGSNATIGHGLGAAPELIIVKQRTGPTPRNWVVYHKAIGSDKYLVLSTTDAQASLSTVWNNTSPTSSVFSVGTSTGTNESASVTYVAYCFAPVAGYSSGFSITGNGSSDGPFCYLGFRPRLILLKRTDTTGDWYLWDTARNPYNLTNLGLLANSSGSELTLVNAVLDANSNGFKIRGADAGINASNGTYVGFAWAESPFAYSRAR